MNRCWVPLVVVVAGCSAFADTETRDVLNRRCQTNDDCAAGDLCMNGFCGSVSAGDTGTGNCNGDVLLRLGPDDARIDSGWNVQESAIGEGTVIRLCGEPNVDCPSDENGAVTFDVDTPCDGVFTVWVRAFDGGGNSDSLRAQIDGQPGDPEIFDFCAGGPPNRYRWNALNRRADGGDSCEFAENPWAPSWSQGSHTITLFPREAVAIARIIVTDDPEFEPGDDD